MELLEVKYLNFAYPGGEEVLKDVSFSVKNGEFVVLCGASGCGKSTLLKLLKRELAPTGNCQGEIWYMGKRQEELDDRTAACEIGFVMQNPEHQIVTDKVWHELAFGLESMGMEQQLMRRRTAETADFFGLSRLFRQNTHELSGGQKQLLNLASIMAMRPRLLILDEPTSQLDPIAASNFISTLLKLNREFGIAVLMTEHRLEEVLPMADRVAVMEKGHLLLYDTPKQVCTQLPKEKSASRILAGFPAAVRIYQALKGTGICPLTVREGQEFLKKNYQNHKVSSLMKTEAYSEFKHAKTVLSLKDVWFRYGREHMDVLENVSLELREGEIVSILGGNGSGKTTLLGVIANLNRAYKGKIRILEKKQKVYKGKDLYVRCLSFLPQNPQLVFLRDTVWEDLQEIRKVMGYSVSEMEEKAKMAAELLGITHLLQRHPYDLSGGEQQKAAIAKILLLEPKILLLDEPTKGIDASAKQQLLEILKNLKKRGTAILMVTHDVEFAAESSDRCGMVFDREIISIEETTGFFAKNQFYTTAANRIGQVLYDNPVTCQDVVELCLENGVRTSGAGGEDES